MEAARKSIGSIFSPFQMVAERVAEYLVPEAPEAPPPPPPPPAAPEEPAPVKAVTPARKSAKKAPAASIKKSPASKKRSPTIKQEPQREMPFRSGRHKAGFYSEANLADVAWSGTGSARDPITIS